MTGRDSETGRQGVFTDTRGRIPFAVVAVLLLVSAVTLVGYMESRGSAETDTDASLAMDRTDAAIQTAVRDGVASAARRAGAEPLTSPAHTSYGDALDRDRPFRSYLEALVYLEVDDRFEQTGQRVGDVETSVSVPPVTDAESFGDGIGRVDISEREPGLLSVEVDGIEITAHRGDEVLTSRNKTINVSVPTPVLQQHERTELFQDRLDAGITSTDIGFTHRFNARIYALGWLRGYAQYAGAPVTEIIANRHVEPSANSALYRTQKDVFGAADPRLRDAVNRGWVCMAAQDAEGLYNGLGSGSVNVADDICRASEWVFGEKHSGELPEFDTGSLLGQVPGMDREHTIGVNETAYSPLRTLVAGGTTHSIEQAIERAFTVETGIDATVQVSRTPTFDHRKPHPRATPINKSRSNSGVILDSGSVAEGDPAANGTFYEFSNVDAAVAVTQERTWRWFENGSTNTATTTANGTIDASVAVRLVEHETAPDLFVDAFNGQVGVDTRYEYGPNSTTENRTVPTGVRNYADRQARVADRVVGGTTLSAFESWLDSRWGNVTTAGGLALGGTRDVVLGPGPVQRGQLISTVFEDVRQLQQTAATITHTFERTEIVRGENETGPVGELVAAVETERAASLDRSRPYENVGQQAVYEVRYAYFERLLSDLERLEAMHGAAMGDLGSHLDNIEGGLNSALSFLQQGVNTEEPDPVELKSPSLTPEITYEISGSPTYLAGESITTEEVPAVEQGSNFSSFAAKNRNYLKLPYETVVSGILRSLLSKLNIGSPDVELTLRTAGEALRAGELAENAATVDQYADEGELSRLTDDLQREVDRALRGSGGFSEQMGVELVAELYGVSPDNTFPAYSGNSTHRLAYDLTETAAARAVDSYNSTATAAIAIGGGNATETLTQEVGDALDSAGLTRPEYARPLTDREWRAVVASAVGPALDRAAANATATVEDTSFVEALDNATREALANVSTDIVSERLGSWLGNGTFDLSNYEDWVGNRTDIDTVVRVPAGLPILPFPTHWVATMNLWNVDADGQYARFEVAANMSAPGRGTSTTYVRENTTVELDIAGMSRTVGAVEPVGFDGRSLLVVVVPPGGIGVGDRDDEDPECTETYPAVGRFDESETSCGPGIGG